MTREKAEVGACGDLLILDSDDGREKSSGGEAERYVDGVAEERGGVGDVGAAVCVEGSCPCRGREAGATGIERAAATGSWWSLAAALHRAAEGASDGDREEGL